MVRKGELSVEWLTAVWPCGGGLRTFRPDSYQAETWQPPLESFDPTSCAPPQVPEWLTGLSL